MDLIRLLVWALIAWLVVVGVRRLAADARAGGTRRAAPAAAEDMVQCASCGLNVPRSEAIAIAGRWACCPEHARQPAARP